MGVFKHRIKKFNILRELKLSQLHIVFFGIILITELMYMCFVFQEKMLPSIDRKLVRFIFERSEAWRKTRMWNISIFHRNCHNSIDVDILDTIIIPERTF